jgi:phosphoinositide-3-kinase, regulatory subunit 4
LAFCENTHSIVSASDNGSIHVSRVEYIGSSTPNGTAKYNGMNMVMTFELENGDKPVAVDHFDGGLIFL